MSGCCDSEKLEKLEKEEIEALEKRIAGKDELQLQLEEAGGAAGDAAEAEETNAALTRVEALREKHREAAEARAAAAAAAAEKKAAEEQQQGEQPLTVEGMCAEGDNTEQQEPEQKMTRDGLVHECKFRRMKLILGPAMLTS